MTSCTIPANAESAIIYGGGIRKHLKYWGVWFRQIGDGTVKETNLNVFFQFGMALENLNARISVKETVTSLYIYLYFAQDWLYAFLRETESLKISDSRAAAGNLSLAIEPIKADFLLAGDRQITQEEVSRFVSAKDEFEKAFDRDHRRLHVFTVTNKALFDTDTLLMNPEEAFPERLRAALPAQAMEDLKQAARCLVFDVPTASAFHICRGTESLMLHYYEKLAGEAWEWPQRDWKRYNEKLIELGAPKAVTDRLEEIRKLDRNAYIHPDKNVSLEEAPFLFTLCINVDFQMLLEIEKLPQ